MADGFNWSSSTAAGSDHDCDDGHHQGSSANNEQAPSVCHGQGDDVRIAAAAACPLGVAAQLPAKGCDYRTNCKHQCWQRQRA